MTYFITRLAQIRFTYFMMGVGQFGEFFACQIGETVIVDKVANFLGGCQSGETANAVKMAKEVDKGINLEEGSKRANA